MEQQTLTAIQEQNAICATLGGTPARVQRRAVHVKREPPTWIPMRAPNVARASQGRTAQQVLPHVRRAPRGTCSRHRASISVYLVMLGSMTMNQRHAQAVRRGKCSQQQVRAHALPVVRALWTMVQNCVHSARLVPYSHPQARHRAWPVAVGSSMIILRCARAAPKDKYSRDLDRRHALHVKRAFSTTDPKNARSALLVAYNRTEAKHRVRIARLAFLTTAQKRVLHVLLANPSCLQNRHHAKLFHARATQVARISLLAVSATLDSLVSSICPAQALSTTARALSALLAGQTPTATAQQRVCLALSASLRLLLRPLAQIVSVAQPTQISMLPPSARPAVPDTTRLNLAFPAFTALLDTTTTMMILRLRVTATLPGVIQAHMLRRARQAVSSACALGSREISRPLVAQ